MRYLGGKSKLAQHIAPIIESNRVPGQLYLEPFVGGGSIVCAVSGPRYACDLNWALVTMWRALRDGWDPPGDLPEDEYEWIKMLRDPRDPMTAFAGFGCSFAGSWFGTYARDPKGCNNFALQARNVLRRQREAIQGVKFRCCDYRELDPDGLLVYSDPPYANTAGYKAVGEFDSDEFWETMFRWAKRNTVLVSEFSAPEDPGIEEIWHTERAVTMASQGSYVRKVDRLYKVWP